jgi:hypothetical protein
MKLRAPRTDPDGTQHMPVAHAADYGVAIAYYHRSIGNGTITCEGLRSPTPAKRLVRLLAEYTDAGEHITHMVQCDSEEDETRQLARLERLILAASRRPSQPPE